MNNLLWKVEKTYSPKSQFETEEYGILNYNNEEIIKGFDERKILDKIVQKHNKTIIECLNNILIKGEQ